MEDFYSAGGLPAVMVELSDLLHLDAPTVTGRTVGENIGGAEVLDRGVITQSAQQLSVRTSLSGRAPRVEVCPPARKIGASGRSYQLADASHQAQERAAEGRDHELEAADRTRLRRWRGPGRGLRLARG